MSDDRILIVNADDFGRSHGVNTGVIRAHEEGIVTSASLMVRWPAAIRAADYYNARKTLSLGLHLDLAEWDYGERGWYRRYEVAPTDDAAAVAKAIERQIEAFVRLVGRPPTHLDAHQHVHRSQPVARLLADAGRSLGIPVRDLTPGISYSGAFYGQDERGFPVPDAITEESLVAIIKGLPEGVTELGCHPGDYIGFETRYRLERATEVTALCAPRVRSTLGANGIQLCSFAELNGAWSKSGPSS